MSTTREKKLALERTAARNTRMTASAIYVDSVMTTKVSKDAIAPGPTIGQRGLEAHPSWGVVAVQYFGDQQQAEKAVKAAGRRIVQKHAGALERLAE